MRQNRTQATRRIARLLLGGAALLGATGAGGDGG